MRSFAYTVDCRHLLKLLIKLEIWTESKKFLMKDQCVIYFGQTLMSVQDGAFHPEELDIHLVRTFQNNLTERMISSLLPEHIN